MQDSQKFMDGALTERQRELIEEIQRIARLLGSDSLSQNEFEQHHCISGLTTVGAHFGAWNRAVAAAGLKPNVSGGRSKFFIDTAELLHEVLRVRNALGKLPSEREMASFGRYSVKPYRDRWGSFRKACEAASSIDEQEADDTTSQH